MMIPSSPLPLAFAAGLALGSLGCRRDGEGTGRSERTPTEAVVKTTSAASTPEIDWSRHLAYQSFPGLGKRGEDYCSATLAVNIETRAVLRLGGTAPVAVSEAELPPGVLRGYSNFWHDGCAANVRGDLKGSVLRESLVAYEPPSAEIFRRFVSLSSALYWLSEEGKQCVRVKTGPFRRPDRREPRDPRHTDPSLAAFASIEIPPEGTWGRLEPFSGGSPWIPFVVVPAKPGHLGYLLMGTWQDGKGDPFLKCQCERLLRVVKADEREVHVLARRLPTDPDYAGSTVREPPRLADEIRYYDVTEVERWFWDEATCNQARLAALARLAEDGRLATKLGFYSGYSEFDRLHE